MRGYISRRENGPRYPIYTFAKTPDAAIAIGKHLCQWIAEDGITIERGFVGIPCTDFRAEPHPRGGFALSCEVPEC
jgi:hypothetical protein